MVKLIIRTAEKNLKSKIMMQLQNSFYADFPCAETEFRLTFSCRDLTVTKQKRNKTSAIPKVSKVQPSKTTLLINFQAAGLQKNKGVGNLLLC